MSFAKVNKYDIVKKQYVHKLHAHHNMFGTMMFVQLIAAFLTPWNQSFSTGTMRAEFFVHVISADIIIIFTSIWMIIVAIQLTTKAAKNKMSTFVTTKQTNRLSNMLFILTLGIIGGVTTQLLGIAVKIISPILFPNKELVFLAELTGMDMVIGIVGTILYLLLFASIGFLIGEIVQLHPTLIIIVPAIIIGLFILFTDVFGEIFAFYFFTSNILIFLIKAGFTVLLCFFISFFIGNRLEVRR